MKKILALLLSALIIFSVLPLSVFADEIGDQTTSQQYSIQIANPKLLTAPIYAGSIFNIKFDLAGLDEADISNWSLYATVSGGDFTLAGYLASEQIKSTSTTLAILAGKSMQSGRYSLRLNVFGTAPNGEAVSASCDFNIDVLSQAVNGKLLISNASVDASEVSAGSLFNVRFFASGSGVSHVKASVSGNGFTMAGSLASQEVKLNSWNVVTVLADENLETGRYQLVLNLDSIDASGIMVSDSCNFNIDVTNDSVILDESQDLPDFVLVNASIPEKTGKADLSTNLTIQLKNNTGYDATDVKVTISNLGAIILNSFTDTVEIGDVDGKETIKATFPIKFPKDPSEQMMLTAIVTYKGENSEVSESFNIYLRCTENSAPADTSSLTPKVIVSNYQTDVEKIVSGDEFILTFVLKNTSVDKDIKNMTVNVIPGADSAGNGTIFSPIDGTTSFYTAQLNKSGELEYSIKLKTSASAGARSYPITISYNFEYENGGYYTSGQGSMDINLPVTQPIKFELMEWYPPTECYGADGCTISFQYFNKSKNPMSNLAVSVEGDFYMPTQYVGTLAASSYDFFYGQIYPNDPSAIGEMKQAILVFTFEDASSNEHRVEYPFDILICEGFVYDDSGMYGEEDIIYGPGVVFDPEEFDDPSMSVDGESEGEGILPAWAWYAIGSGALVVIAIIIIVCVTKKRKNALLDDYDDDDDF